MSVAPQVVVTVKIANPAKVAIAVVAAVQTTKKVKSAHAHHHHLVKHNRNNLIIY